jgi:hypothetical protein
MAMEAIAFLSFPFRSAIFVHQSSTELIICPFRR